jgi:Carboxypeptidase regulatory-like domain
MRTAAVLGDMLRTYGGSMILRPAHLRGRGLPTSRGAPLILALALAAGLALAACGVSGGGGTGTVPGPNEGTLAGQVLAGPTCPVERAENPCPPRPVPGRHVDVQTPGGQVVATATTDTLGNFTVTLAPGTYVVRVPSTPPSIYPRQTAPVNVTIRAGQTTHVQIVLDTGIR